MHPQFLPISSPKCKRNLTQSNSNQTLKNGTLQSTLHETTHSTQVILQRYQVPRNIYHKVYCYRKDQESHQNNIYKKHPNH